MVNLVSIIIPVRNQADHIRTVVEVYEQSLTRLPSPHELIIVVNASTDSTMDVCRELEREYSAIRAVQSDAGGWGLAVKIGLHAARGELICYTNCARTRIEDLMLLLIYSLAYPNVVMKANRKIRDGWLRRLGSLLYNLECRALFDLSYWDINGTPKVFPRSFDKLLGLTQDGDLIDVEFNIICRREDYPMLEVPIFSSRRQGGKSTTTVFSAWKMYVGAIRLWQELRKSNP